MWTQVYRLKAPGHRQRCAVSSSQNTVGEYEEANRQSRVRGVFTVRSGWLLTTRQTSAISEPVTSKSSVTWKSVWISPTRNVSSCLLSCLTFSVSWSCLYFVLTLQGWSNETRGWRRTKASLVCRFSHFNCDDSKLSNQQQHSNTSKWQQRLESRDPLEFFLATLTSVPVLSGNNFLPECGLVLPWDNFVMILYK